MDSIKALSRYSRFGFCSVSAIALLNNAAIYYKEY